MSKDREVVAKRYAVALFELAKEKSVIDTTEEELLTIREVLSKNKQLVEFLHHPKVANDMKTNVIKAGFGTFLSQHVLNTLLLLVDRKREEIIRPFIDQFIVLANEERGIADAKVYSVKPLSEDEKKALAETFAVRLSKKMLRIENLIDSELIGGVKLVIGNRVYDGSVSGKLSRIQRQLVSTRR
jgi:F-type H+-transporting ATPase subunit delta